MFADDTNETFAVSTMADLENTINLELGNLNRWLITNRLSLNVAKTEFMIIARWGGGVLPYTGYIGMCGAKGYGFLAVLI